MFSFYYGVSFSLLFFFSFFSSTFFSLTCLHIRFPQDVGKFCFDKSRNETLSAAFGVFPNRKVLCPPRSIYIFFYCPFKLNEWPIKRIKRQSCISRPDIDTEIRLVTMFLDSVIYEIERYFCRLWYRGQPLVCNLCCTQGQKSADCPDKDECRRCRQLGDFYLGVGTCAFC